LDEFINHHKMFILRVLQDIKGYNT